VATSTSLTNELTPREVKILLAKKESCMCVEHPLLTTLGCAVGFASNCIVSAALNPLEFLGKDRKLGVWTCIEPS